MGILRWFLVLAVSCDMLRVLVRKETFDGLKTMIILWVYHTKALDNYLSHSTVSNLTTVHLSLDKSINS